MSDDPALRTSIVTGGNQIGILPGSFAEGNPPQADPSSNDAHRQEAGHPDGQRSPGGKPRRSQKDQHDQSQCDQPGAEDGKGAKTRRREKELLGSDGVTQVAEIGCDELPSGRRFRRARLPGKREQPTGEVPVQDEAARLGRLATANAFPAVASAARCVSAVIWLDSISSSRC